MNKAMKFGIAALLLVGLVGSAFAYGGKGLGNEETRAAMDADDFSAWKSAMQNGLTEERFNEMRQRHTKIQQHRKDMDAHREEIDNVIEAGYNTWKELVSKSPRGVHLLEVINENNFETFAAMHDARVNKDIDTAKTLAEELGIQGIGRGAFGKGQFKEGIGKDALGQFKGRMH